jgi:hypothetical protein
MLSQLRVEQKIEKDDHLYSVTPALNNLLHVGAASGCDGDHRSASGGIRGKKWPRLFGALSERTLKLGKAGDWDGFDVGVDDGLLEKGQPIVEVQNVKPNNDDI